LEEKVMLASIETQFQQAVNDVTKLSEAPDTLVKLKLYALYKQATSGDCTGERPGMFDFAGRAKYDAWKELAGQTNDQAAEKYIALVEELKAADKK
jgi:diazepam-binding inhibitor (GABA receptor modulator, acyl-CoA-binding protein)